MTARAGRRRPFGRWPLPATLAIAGALLAVWEGLVAPHLPPPVFHPNRGDRALFWVAPREGPYYVVGDPSRAETVFLGDSRVFEDVVLDLAEGGGLGRCATVWGTAADLPELLRAVRDLPAARFVIRFDFRNIPAARTVQRSWWLVLMHPHVDICMKDPGHPVDAVIAADLETFTRVWMGYLGSAEGRALIP